MIEEGLQGSYRGVLPDERLVFSGSDAPGPYAVDPSDGERRDVNALRSTDFVWDAETNGMTGLALVSRRAPASEFDGAVYELSANGGWRHLRDVTAYTDLAVAGDGTTAAFVSQDRRSARTPPEVFVLVDGQLGQLRLWLDVDGSFPWVAAIAVS